MGGTHFESMQYATHLQYITAYPGAYGERREPRCSSEAAGGSKGPASPPVRGRRQCAITQRGHHHCERRHGMTEAYAPHHTLVFQFVGALLQRTLHCPTAAAHQQALHGFLDDLTP